jgi:amidase
MSASTGTPTDLDALYDASDALGLAALVRAGEVTARELVEVALRRIDRVNPAINAVVHRMDDEARRVADSPALDGPFAGVPFLLKDLLSHYAGAPTTSGSRLLDGFVPDHDSEMVRRWRSAGLIVVGKTNSPEFGITPFTEPARYGPTLNPWDLSRTAGGSSGGSAAAVAAGIVPMAGGGDGGGSIRIPASCCGLFGFKPSRGRTPTGPDEGELWQGAAIEHVLTWSVRDSAAALDATRGPDPGAPYGIAPPERPYLDEVARDPGALRVAFTSAPLLGHAVDPECARAVDDAARLLESLGHHVEEAAPPADREPFNRAFLTMVCGELRADLDDAERATGRRASPATVEPATWALAMLGRAMSAEQFAVASRTLQRAARRVGQWFERYDVLLTPTLATPPVPTGALQPTRAEMVAIRAFGALHAGGLLRRAGMLEQAAEKVFDFIPYTPLFNVTGQPAMSVPLARSADGLPIGVQCVARFGDEATLFRLAGQLERASPWPRAASRG